MDAETIPDCEHVGANSHYVVAPFGSVKNENDHSQNDLFLRIQVGAETIPDCEHVGANPHYVVASVGAVRNDHPAE